MSASPYGDTGPAADRGRSLRPSPDHRPPRPARWQGRSGAESSAKPGGRRPVDPSWPEYMRPAPTQAPVPGLFVGVPCSERSPLSYPTGADRRRKSGFPPVDLEIFRMSGSSEGDFAYDDMAARHTRKTLRSG